MSTYGPRFVSPVALLAILFSLPSQGQESADEPAIDDSVEFVQVCARWDDDNETWDVYSPAGDQGCEIIGSRRGGRSAADSPVPVDVIGVDELLAHGDTNLDSLLASVVPSFNVSQGADAAMFMRPATLRGLAPDATLVLVNGKRRHRGAIVALLGSGISSGAQGQDLAAIPAIAVERVEVLRDGASAQYGSDAIAGALNIVLNRRRGVELEAKVGSHFEGDGDAVTLGGNIGMALGSDGWGNISFEWKEADPTVRSVQRADAQALIDAGNTAVPRPVAQKWGLPRLSDDRKLFVNMGTALGESAEAYAFGNWGERQLEGGFYYRNPHTRQGVFAGDPLADGTSTVKVADLSADGTGNCPAIPVVGNRADAGALSAVRANPACYSLIDKFPGGFTPQFGAFIKDVSAAAGVRGSTANGWRWDASIATGSSNARFYIHNTVNPQLLGMRDDIPTRYRIGAYTAAERVANLDFAKPFGVAAWAGSLNVAFGLEYRSESFDIDSGERNSYYIDPNLEYGLAAQGFGIGSNGFPGFPPRHSGENTLNAYAAYLDLEGEVSERLLVGGAVRFEDHADFGDTLDGKVTARLDLSDAVAVRGAASTGFRVPTAGQANLRNVLTAFRTIDGVGRLVDTAILPPTDPVAQRKGAQALTPEQSTHLTFGFVFDVGALAVTLDYYSITIEDRISFTSPFQITDDDVAALLAAGVPDASSIGEVRFFSNQQEVDVSGVDVVATWPFSLGAGSSTLTLAANFSNVDLRQYNPMFTSANRVAEIEDGRPESRLTATWVYDRARWSALARVRHYGEHYDAPTGGGGWGAYRPEPATLVDLQIEVDLTSSFALVLGGQNVFDTYPQANPNMGVPAFNGLPWPENSPVGFQGGSYYVRATWRSDG